jgi:hypothetical protein
MALAEKFRGGNVLADLTPKDCALKTAGAVGVAFLTLSATVDNLVTYIGGPGWAWIGGGVLLTSFWAYETYCREDIDR